MNTPTPAPAHVALVRELLDTASEYRNKLVSAPRGRLIAAIQALYDALAQPALAAPVLPHCWMVSGSSRAHFGEYAEHDATEEARRCGGGARAYPLHMPQQPTPAATPEPCKSDSGECHYDGGCLFHGACMHNYDAAPVTEIPVSDQVMQPVEASPEVREWIEEAMSYVGCESWSPSCYRDGDDLLAKIDALKVEVAAPVAPTEMPEPLSDAQIDAALAAWHYTPALPVGVSPSDRTRMRRAIAAVLAGGVK